MNAFQRKLQQATGQPELTAHSPLTLQVNLGLRCNLACTHCHLAASPQRSESMGWETMAAVLELARNCGATTVDLTGGAPELNPLFRPFVTDLRKDGLTVQVRTNLVVLTEPEQQQTPAFLRDLGVHLVASLPCYLEANVDHQRGEGSHARAVSALRTLNDLGYGVEPHLPLNLVYNPGGPFLPPAQCQLEADYKRELARRHGITFSRLLTIANVPIGRYLSALRRNGQDDAYRTLLERSFNPATLPALMCRSQLSIGWDGTLYDCDFNLALGLPLAGAHHISAPEGVRLHDRPIVVGEHCLACTAGSGSSCAGALVA